MRSFDNPIALGCESFRPERRDWVDLYATTFIVTKGLVVALATAWI